MNTLLRGATGRSLRKAAHAAALTVWRRNVRYDSAGEPNIPKPSRAKGSPPPVGKAERRRIALRPMRALIQRSWLGAKDAGVSRYTFAKAIRDRSYGGY